MTRARALLLAEACCLLLLGASLSWLALSEHYWRLLNPKFLPVTLAAGVLSLLLGLVHPLGRAVRGRLSSLVGVAVFLLLFGVTLVGMLEQKAVEPVALFDPGPPPAPSVTFADAPEPVIEPSRISSGGVDYVKLNTMELLLRVDGHDAAVVGPVAVQGMASRLPDDAYGPRFALCRVTVTCCLADAVATGFVVRAALPEQVADHSWVRVLGRLAPLAGEVPGLGEVQAPMSMFTVLHQEYQLAATLVEPVSEPQIPFIFEYRDQEPYAY